MKQLSLINFALAAATGGAGGGMTPEERQDLQDLKKKVADLETSKDLGVVVVGSPQIHGSQISEFSADDYLMMPRIIEFGNSKWQLDFQFTTGADVQAQQNIIDSAFGLALAIAQGKLEVALSSNGTSWNLGAHFGTKVLSPNTSYFVRMTFDGSKYVVAVSTDRKTYTTDITVNSTASLYPVQIYIGKSPNNAHIFGGSIYLYYAALSINDEIVWTGTLGGELKDELRELETVVSHKVATINNATPDENGNINVAVMTPEQQAELAKALQMQGQLTELDLKVGHINGVMGPYTEREPIMLTLQENGKAINRAGVKVDKAGWAICSFIGKKGDVYSFNPGVMDGDVCIFSEEITKQESRPIEYKYTYDEEGLPLSASATYNGAIHSYTWSYERDEEGNIISETITDDQTCAHVNALPYQYQAEVGTYHPLTILNESAELPIDKHCRLISHFQGEGTIRVTVSFNVASADMNLLVFRDGLIANLATQLGTIFQMISETNKALALVEQLAQENAELIAYIRQATDNMDFSTLPTLCGQPMMLFGAGTPQEAIVPENWKQYDPVTGEGYQWNGMPSALGQVYINTSASTNGRYTAVPNEFGNLKWANF